MKLGKKILITVLIIVVVIFLSLSLLVALFGKKLVESQIEKNLGMKATIGGISLGLPLRLSVSKLEIGDLLKAERISVSPNLLGFLAGKVVLDGLTIVEPVINIEQSAGGKLNFTLPQQKGKPPEVYLTGLNVKNGKATFVDKKVLPQGFAVALDTINIDISKVMIPPTSLNAKFNMSARLIDPVSKKLGDIAFKGFIDFCPKDMDAVFQLRDFNVVYFAPYYGDFISTRKLLSGKLDIASNLKAKNDDLDVATNFRLYGLTYVSQETSVEGELPSLDLAKNALDLFTDKQGNLALEFNFKTKLTSPSISVSEIKKMILSAAAKNLASQNPQDLIDKVVDTVKQFEGFGKQMKDIFKKSP
ncbi:MAG: DUF748 domain-containing protein [Candidatus Omnitrophica bacterium]|nr:DUF748 domain-containing protein [Candidatus Omnitrophota bacterium]